MQTAAGVLGMVSGFLFGSSLASAGLLPSSLNVQLAPVTFDSGVLLLALMSLSRLFVGVVTLVLVKLAVEKLAKQVGIVQPRDTHTYIHEYAAPLRCASIPPLTRT